MIKVEKAKVSIQGKTDELVKEICYAIVALRFQTLDEGTSMGFDKEAIDSEFKMMVLGGVANSMSDDVDGYISEEQVAQKLHEITDRAYAHMGKGLN